MVFFKLLKGDFLHNLHNKSVLMGLLFHAFKKWISMDVEVWNLMIFLKNLWLVGFTVLTQQYMIFLKICYADFFFLNLI